MSENQVSEFQIPVSNGDQQSPTIEARNIVDEVYGLNSVNQEVNNSPETKEIIEKLQIIGSDIENARKNAIDIQHLRTNKHINNVRMFTKGISKLLFTSNAPVLSNLEIVRRRLIDQESEIGATIFGQKSDKDTVNKFFLDSVDKSGNSDWYYYHEENINELKGKHHKVTLHYEVKPEGVLLYKTGQLSADYIGGDELNNFYLATEKYRQLVLKQYSLEKVSNKSSFSKKIINNLVRF